MSKITNRDTVPREGGPVEHRLARLLDAPFLARVVPYLPPETLQELIRYRGLEACGEIVTAATPAQLTGLLDLDLWRHGRAGRDHLFDVDRFGEWLEVLVDTGNSVAARTVAALDKDLVITGLSGYVRVFDAGIFEPTAQSDDEPPDRHEAMREGDSLHADDAPVNDASGDRRECEVGGYVVRARRADAWDAIVALLIALDEEHGNDFHAVMQGCRRLSNSRPEGDGLDDLLRMPEQHLHDVTIERERRRAQQGYATPADARAFLEMARQPKDARSGASMTGGITGNPIVTAYFRAADEAPDSANGAAHSPQRTLLACVRDTDETAYFARSRELAFLANALLAGCSVQSRPFTPREASDAAAAICNLGLECWPVTPPDTCPPASWLIDHDLVTAFEAGWSVLHKDVSLYAAEQLISTLADVDCADRDIRNGLVALRRTLVKQRDAGTPWRARDAAEVLAMLDVTAWIGVLGLLDECPVLPAALTAVLERRTTTVSATEFAFISTAAQIGDVRIFMMRLPDLLSR